MRNKKQISQRDNGIMAAFVSRLSSSALALPFALSAPILFMWSKNWQLYSWYSLTMSFVVLLGGGCLLFAAGLRIQSLWDTKCTAIPGWVRLVFLLALCVVMSQSILYFLDIPLHALVNENKIIIVNIVFTAFLCLICLFSKFKIINTLYFASLVSPGGVLVLEWVPVEDSQVRRLLAARQNVFDDYTLEGCLAAFSGCFTLRMRHAIQDSVRTLLVLQRN